MILNYYSAIGMIAMLILLIENMDILLNRGGGFTGPAWKVYRRFLIAVAVYYVADILWGILESYRQATLLFIDTTIYFIAMAVGIHYWTKYCVTYLEEEKDAFGRGMMRAGQIFGIAVAAITAVNIFTPVLFTVDENSVYKELPARYVVLALQILLLLLISVYTFTSVIQRRRPAEDGQKYRALGKFGLIMAVFLFAQMLYPYLPLYAVAFMLGTCLLRASVIGAEKEQFRDRLKETERITEKRLEEERLREERNAYNRISAMSGEFLSIHIVDPETERYHEYSANEGYRSFDLPEEGEHFFERTREYSRSLVYPEDLERFMHVFTRENVLAEIERTGLFSLTYRLMVQDRPVYIRLKCAMVEEDEGRRLVVGINDVDAQVKREQDIEKRLAQAQNRALIDALTGVKNKYSYLDTEGEMDRRIEAQAQPPFAIVVLDVNDLKKINDRYGHQAGDEYLLEACRAVCEVFKHSPVFRVGGDEFAVIAQGHDYDHIEELVDRVAEHNDTAARSGGAVIACGMSRFEGDASVASVFSRADKYMYENKKLLKQKYSTPDGEEARPE